jgi:hypothetical protein
VLIKQLCFSPQEVGNQTNNCTHNTKWQDAEGFVAGVIVVAALVVPELPLAGFEDDADVPCKQRKHAKFSTVGPK